MLEAVLKNPWVRAVGALLVLALLVLLGYMLLAVLVPVFFAFIVAYIFDPVADYMETKKISRSGAVGIIIGLLLIAMIGTPLLILPGMFDQAERLISVAKEEGDANQWFDAMLNKLPLESLVEALQDEEAAVDTEGAEDVAPENARVLLAQQLGELMKERIVGYIKGNPGQVATQGGAVGVSALSIVNSVTSGIMGFILFLGNFVLFAFIAAYLLKDYDNIIAGMHDLVPPRFRDKLSEIFTKIDSQLKGYLRGQVTVCFLLGIMYAIGLSVSGVPFALPIAFIGALATFIPFVGPVITLLPSVTLTLLQYGLDWHILGVIATIALAQTIEGNYLTPKIVGSSVGLSPVWVILAIMVFSTTLGFLGLLLAVPLAAISKVLIQEGVVVYRESAFFAKQVE